MSRWTVAALAFVAVVSSSASLRGGDVKTSPALPPELIEVAASHECEPIDEFLAREGMIDPPFVYGVFRGREVEATSEGWRIGSAAFWCRTKANRERFKLIAHAMEAGPGLCPAVVWETDDYPGGLSVAREAGERISGYWDVLNQQEASIGEDSVWVLYSFYDGLGNSFICRHGRWLIKQWD